MPIYELKKMDIATRMEHEIRLLPHHIGIFTDFYMRPNNAKRTLLDQKMYGYSDDFLQHEKNTYEKSINESNVTIRVVLEKPDSICEPTIAENCRECLNSKEDTLHAKFERAVNLSYELLYLLHYRELAPCKSYSPPEFRKIIEITGRKIYELLAGHSDIQRGINPRTLVMDYRWEDKERVDKQFPMAARFYNSGVYEDIMGRHLSENIVADHEVRDCEVTELIKKYPEFFSDEPNDAYAAVLKMLS